MCGIVATVTPRTASRVGHRGPDASGASGSLVLPWCFVSMEMTRLSIVDRRPISVPFDFRESCGVVLAFNGEIYNWRSLRSELSDGVPWQTECDAEVVARAWRKWGPRMLDRFNGMWGLALVDEFNGTVFLARDRAGEKPLYYASLGRGLTFASEIKALPVALKEAPCADASVLEFDCLETTPFHDVRRLGPGECLLLESASDLVDPTPVRWWELPDEVDHGMTRETAVDQTEALLVDAIRLRAVSEVPVGVQLSGGLDSAIVQAVVRSDRLYTVTFPQDGVDNLVLARAAALGVAEPIPVTFGLEDLKAWLPQVAYHLDTPATWTAVCQWALNRRMAEDGVVVVFSGEGADEIFGGYSRYRVLWWLEQMASDPRLAAYGPLREYLVGSSTDVLARLIDRSGGVYLDHARNIVSRFSRGRGLVGDASKVDFYTTMQALLRMADAMSAAHSMENRSPFLDHRVMELGAKIPMQLKVDGVRSKAVLMEVAKRLGVPGSVVDQPTKRGLFVPWQKWNTTTGARGSWDRGGFAEQMRSAWRSVFFSA